MTKTTSAVILAVIVAVLAFIGVFAFLPEFNYGSYGEFRSPATHIQKSALFTDNHTFTYSVELDENVTDAQIKDVINYRLSRIYGLYGSKIKVENGNATVTIPEIANYNSSKEDLTTSGVMSIVTARGVIEVVSDQTGTYTAENVILTAEHLKSASTRTLVDGDVEYPVAVVKLTKEGKELAKSLELTSGSFYVDQTVIGGVQYANESTLYFYTGSDYQASQVACYINSGALLADLSADDNYVGTPDKVGVHNNSAWVILAILGAVVIGCGIFFIIRYNILGLAGILSQIFTIVIGTYFAGLVHLEIFNISALVGVLLGLGLQTFFTVYAFDKIKGYSENTFASAKYKGFLNANKLNLIVHAIVLVVGIILWVIPTIVTAPLGNVLVYLAVLSFVATMGLNRLFASLIAPFVEGKKTTRK